MPDETPAATPADADLTARQAEIVDAAAAVFAERGYAGGSMREIAARVGVSEPALYRHFPGKQALFVMVIRVIGGRARTEAERLIDAITVDRIGSGIVAAFDDRRRAIRTFGPLLRAIANAAASDPVVLAEFRSVVAVPVIAHLTAHCAALDDAFGVPDAETTRPARVRALLALFVGTMVSSFVLDDRPDEAAAEAALRIMQWTGDPGSSAPR